MSNGSDDGKQVEYLQFGGMAVVEGVMMRSPNYYSVACRAPNQEIVVTTEPLEKTWIGRQKWLQKPFLRGTLALLDTMALGMKAMNWASAIHLDERYQSEEEKQKEAKAKEESTPQGGSWFLTVALAVLTLMALFALLAPTGAPNFLINGWFQGLPDAWGGIVNWTFRIAAAIFLIQLLWVWNPKSWAPVARWAEHNEDLAGKIMIGFTVVFSLAIGFFIFDVIPVALVQVAKENLAGLSSLGANYIEEIVKMVMFIGYLALIRRLPAILETFKYHGAEHKAINAMEAKVGLEADACLAQTRLHPRCGTNFAIIVLIVSFLLFPLLPRDLPAALGLMSDTPGWIVVATRVLAKLAILPLVAGISYEVIRLAGKMKDQRWVNILLRPGLATQLITTAEPAREHQEVAIASLKAVVTAEDTGELTNTAPFNPDEAAEAGEPPQTESDESKSPA
jgi:uncharacterized protein YqhQ